jgi:Tol biopolymer transport system component
MTVVLGTIVIMTAVPAGALSASTKRESVSSTGAQANGKSEEPSISKTGRYVAFSGRADNLGAGDSNGVSDCFVRDVAAKRMDIVSVHSSGIQANGACFGPSISASGRYVAFESVAPNLVDGDANGTWDVFLRDRRNGTTEIISLSSGGAQGNGESRDPWVSPNGRFVAFESLATTLVDGDTNGTWDVYVRDRQSHTTERVSVRSDGTIGNRASRDPAISGGRYVVFQSDADNLVPGDSNKRADVFIHDRKARKTVRASVSSDGVQARAGSSSNPTISSNGRFVAFDSTAKNLVKDDTNGARDIFVRDTKTGTTQRLSSGRQANGISLDPTISSSGRWVSFESYASNLVSGDTNRQLDAFVYDRNGRRMIRVSVRSDGKQSRGGGSHDAAVSANGGFVTFESEAGNLVRGDTNGVEDVFRRGRLR